jgi:nucleotidyltransferase/DNA polymerase involved in DNA repair
MSYVACVLLPNLPIALARQDQPELAARPLILYSVSGGRALVAAASDDAGVAAGIPLRQARLRCPQAACLIHEPDRVARAVTVLERTLGAFSPRVALAIPAPDAALLLDLGRLELPRALGIIGQLGQHIRAELGVSPAIGAAANQQVALHAARRAGVGLAVLAPPGAEADLLAPQPIATLGLADELAERLAQLGVRTVGELVRLPLDALQAQFGGAGRRLYQLARGIDTTRIPATTGAPSLSRTGRFAGPLLDRMLLERAIARLAERLSAQLLAEGWSAGALALTLTLDDGAPLVLERALTEPSSAAAVLASALLALNRAAALEAGVTAVTVSAHNLAPVVVEQLELFAPAAGHEARLRDVLARLGGRFAGSLLRAELADTGAVLPERRITLRPL